MKTAIRWIVIGALTLLMAALIVLGPSARSAPAIAAFELAQSSPTPNEQVLPSFTPQSGTSGIPVTGITATAPLPSSVSMVQIRDQACMRKIPYTILSMPKTATFQVVQPAGYAPRTDPVTHNLNQLVCKSVLTLGDTQTVVCTGPEASTFILHVTNGTSVEDVTIPLSGCTRSAPESESGSGPLPQPTTAPSSTPMPNPQPTDTAPAPQPTDTSAPLPTLPIGTP